VVDLFFIFEVRVRHVRAFCHVASCVFGDALFCKQHKLQLVVKSAVVYIMPCFRVLCLKIPRNAVDVRFVVM